MSLSKLIDRSLRRHDLEDHMALSDNSEVLTYKDLKRKVYFFSDFLVQKGVRPGDRVAVLMERSVNAAIVIYSILFVGAAYVPLNMKDPTERLLSVINAADVRCIVGASKDISNLKLPDLLSINIDKVIFDLSDHIKFNIVSHKSLAVILYTSGSTGKPKLIAISHKSIISFVKWSIDYMQISNKDVISNIAPFTFDLSLFDLFAPIIVGAMLIFTPQSVLYTPTSFSQWIAFNNITILYTVPSVLIFWSEKGNLQLYSSKFKLRIIMFAGEVFPVTKLRVLIDCLKYIQFFNLYGPAETNVCCCWNVDRKRLDKLSVIPIGNPVCGAKLKICSTTSELLISSPTKMLGYWDQELINHSGWYRSGDIVEKNSLGEYIYKGRIDSMFKYFGLRIEPSEVESAILRNMPQVKECIVMKIKTESSEKLICTLYGDLDNITKQSITNLISQLLPQYMIPTTFIELLNVPYLPNGKKDIKTIESMVYQKIDKNEIIF